jgi:cytochrome P450
MRVLRPRVEELTAGRLDDLAEHGPPAGLHQALALALPIQVICELLGDGDGMETARARK